jgi:hypothetical protein
MLIFMYSILAVELLGLLVALRQLWNALSNAASSGAEEKNR